MSEALVVGHICLDIIPELPDDVAFTPGRLVEAGPATLSTGGAVANTGLSLARLGVDTQLVGKVGTDAFGRTIREMLDAFQPGLGRALAVVAGESTSYTIVINLSGRDRMFLHDPGCNATFASSDVPDAAIASARIMHLGYPPLLAAMYRDDGEELVRLFRRAKSFGVLTSLDMTLPDANSDSGRIDWRRLFERVLPYVDVFLPSIEELAFALEGCSLGSIPAAGDEIYSRLAATAMKMGVKFAGVKAGDQGFYLRVAPDACSLKLGRGWSAGEYWTPPYLVDVKGTTGAGDATIAGFLMGLLRFMSPEEALAAASAAGASCCERPDAASGVQSWGELKTRICHGWPRREINPGTGWSRMSGGSFAKS